MPGRVDAGATDEYVEKDFRLGGNWSNISGIHPTDYECGFCGNQIGTGAGYNTQNGFSVIAICPRCNRPTFFDAEEGRRYPSSVPGKPVSGVTAELADLYDEARYAAGAGAYTAAVMVCRKMLMNIAVDNGADEGLGFEDYINHLGAKRLFSPRMGAFVSHIRTLGNDANHKIALNTEEDALLAIVLVEGLIRHNYELPAKLPKKLGKAVEETPPIERLRGNGRDPNPTGFPH